MSGDSADGILAIAPALGFVVGLVAEARIAARFGHPVLAGGGTPAGATQAATRLAGQGVAALVSFGLAGGLDPALRPGMVIVPSFVLHEGELLSADAGVAQRFGGPTAHTIVAGLRIVADAASKRRLRAETNAHAIDLESGSVARVAAAHGLPFVAVRAICDPAERDLPPAALAALDLEGGIGVLRVLGSLCRQPGQALGLLALARDAVLARRALTQVVERFQVKAQGFSR